MEGPLPAISFGRANEGAHSNLAPLLLQLQLSAQPSVRLPCLHSVLQAVILLVQTQSIFQLATFKTFKTLSDALSRLEMVKACLCDFMRSFTSFSRWPSLVLALIPAPPDAGIASTRQVRQAKSNY